MPHDIPWPVFTFVLTAIVGVYSFITRGQSVQREQFAGLEKSHATLNERVGHMPTAPEVNELTVAVSELTVEMRSFREKLNSVERRLDIHDEWEFRREAPTR